MPEAINQSTKTAPIRLGYDAAEAGPFSGKPKNSPAHRGSLEEFRALLIGSSLVVLRGRLDIGRRNAFV